MKKFLAKFLVYLTIALVALPAMILMTPVKTQAATSTAPVTKFSTTPNMPQGQDGWYTSVVVIKLESNQDGKTYFQWNSTEGEWTAYQDRFRAWRGQNTLYYYSVDRLGEKETIKSQTIKVDYERPAIPGFQASGENGQVKLTWQVDEGVKSFYILKNNSPYQHIATVPATQKSYLDQEVIVGRTYIYDLIAIDKAGNQSQSATVRVQVLPVVVKKEIQPAIGEGIAVVALPQKVEAKEEKVEPKQETPTVTAEEKAPIKNWNRLFVALSILIIAAGAAIAGYYGYEWWLARQGEEPPKDKKTSSRW